MVQFSCRISVKIGIFRCPYPDVFRDLRFLIPDIPIYLPIYKPWPRQNIAAMRAADGFAIRTALTKIDKL